MTSSLLSSVQSAKPYPWVIYPLPQEKTLKEERKESSEAKEVHPILRHPSFPENMGEILQKEITGSSLSSEKMSFLQGLAQEFVKNMDLKKGQKLAGLVQAFRESQITALDIQGLGYFQKTLQKIFHLLQTFWFVNCETQKKALEIDDNFLALFEFALEFGINFQEEIEKIQQECSKEIEKLLLSSTFKAIPSALHERSSFIEKVLCPFGKYLSLMLKVDEKNLALGGSQLVELIGKICEIYNKRKQESSHIGEWSYVKKGRDIDSSRSFFINLANREVIILAKTGKGVKALGEGVSKKVSLAIHLFPSVNKVRLEAQATVKKSRKMQSKEDESSFLLPKYHTELRSLAHMALPYIVFNYKTVDKSGKALFKTTTFQKKFATDLFELIVLAQEGKERASGLLPLTIANEISIFKKLAQAVYSLHTFKHKQEEEKGKSAVGFIHQDNKPENILLDIDAEGSYVPYVIDFESLKKTDEALKVPACTSGTVNYWPPEVLADTDYKVENYPSRDIFSLGAVFYMTIKKTAIPWFEEAHKKNIAEVIRMLTIVHLRNEKIDAELKAEKDPERKVALDLAQLVMSMFHIDYTRRPKADEVLQRVQTVASEFAKSNFNSELFQRRIVHYLF